MSVEKSILLIKLLTDVGISALNTINAVNSMTDEELDAQIEYWDAKRKELVARLKK